MKPGDLVQRHRSIALDYQSLTSAYEEAESFNRKINLVWAFATNRETPPPFKCVAVPPNSTSLLLDDRCKEFYKWVENSRFDDPRNVLSTHLVKLLYEGNVIVTFAKWIEPVHKENYILRGEL